MVCNVLAMRTFTVALLALTLAGCSGYFERERARDAALITERCAAIGFTPGTVAFANCGLELEKARIAAKSAPTIATQSPPRPLSCTSYTLVGITNTDCQ